MILSWFSCGITSAIATKIALGLYPKVRIIYFEIASAHPDNKRFIKDCEKWYGQEIEIVSGKYLDQFDVIDKTKYVNGPGGARCTLELKKQIRLNIEKECDYDGQVFGFEFTKKEVNRAVRFKEQYPVAKPLFPLIDKRLTKKRCHGILEKAGIEMPEMYKLGYSNNNCIGCVKGGMGYWNKIRKDFPEYFNKMAKLERDVKRSCVNGVFLDDLDPARGRIDKEIMPDCGAFCEIEFADIISPETEKILDD